VNKTKRPSSHGKNLVVKHIPFGDSTIDMAGLSQTDVVWVKTQYGNGRLVTGGFIRLDEGDSWKYSAIEVYKASPEQVVSYLKKRHFVELEPGVERNLFCTINGFTEWLAGWGPEAQWFDVSRDLKQYAEDAAKRCIANSQKLGMAPHSVYKPIVVKLGVNGADLGTYRVTVKFTPEFEVKEIRDRDVS
jgi:hypothetical protein